MKLLVGVLTGVVMAATELVAGADVQVNVAIGVPPPPVVALPWHPRLVIVPTTPAVQYAPDVDVNFFWFGGSYYTFHEGAWFVAPAWNGPWVFVQTVQVPRAIRIVPARYYRVPPRYVAHQGHPHGMPPGQAKKLYATPPPGHMKHGG